jgi:hypothetical protein
MADSPKSLADIRVLLEEAVQVVKDLEARISAVEASTPLAEDILKTDNATEQVSEVPSDNPTPPTA